MARETRPFSASTLGTTAMTATLLCVATILLVLTPNADASDTETITAEPSSVQTARDLVATSGVHGGLVVHVGCGDGRMTAALRVDDRYIVQGLDADAANVDAARRHIQEHDRLGPVTVDTFDGRHLPYVDNLVNLLVAEDLGDVSMDEVMRVLAPLSVACVRHEAEWTRIVKPWPNEIDEWTHWLHDAGGNAVGRDQVVGPPRHYQWTASPSWSKHHDTVLTTSAMVTAGGRLFAIVDESPSSEFHENTSGNWFLLARDAFSGVLLWKVPMPDWGWQAWGESFTKRFAQPVQLPSRLVAHGDRVYVTLGFRAPVSAIDATSGKLLKTYENTRCADEILLHDGRLIVTVHDPSGERSKKTIRVVDPASGHTLWESGPHEGLPARYDAVEGWDPLYVTAHGDRVVSVSKTYVECLDLNSGRRRWRIPRPPHLEHQMHLGVRASENCSLINHGDVVLFTQPVGRLPHSLHSLPCEVHAFSAATGETLWTGTCAIWAWGHQTDVFVIRDLVWVFEHVPTEMNGPDPIKRDSIEYALLGLDLHTGQVKKRIPTNEIFRVGHHHRCYRNKATTNYIFSARRGTETTSLESGELRVHPWVRGECRFGIVPANGLLYTAPHPCACYAGVSLTGYNALAATRTGLDGDAGPPLQKGPAYGRDMQVTPTGEGEIDWPTYRRDGGRSAFTPTRIAPDLEIRWQCRLDGPLSAPTVSAGRVYTAEKERHAVVALDAGNGRLLWRFTACGRIDSPPTAARGRVVFGSADGRVYCLDATDGTLVWRFRAAPSELRMVVDDRIESVWPVQGGVLVQNDEVVAIAGRSSYLDGGLYAYRLDLESGRVLQQRQISHERLTDRNVSTDEGARYDDYYTEGTLADVPLTRDGSVFLKTTSVFGDGRRFGPLLTAQSGFLDNSLFERSFWFMVRPKQTPIGAQLIVHDNETVFGFRAYLSTARGGPWHVLGSGYTLFAAPLLAENPSSAKRPLVGALPADYAYVPGQDSRLLRAFAWSQKVPVRASAMVLTEDALLLAGSPDVVLPTTDPHASLRGELGGRLLVVSRAGGDTLAEYNLEAPPTWDGMAVASGRLFMTMQDGTVSCMGLAQ